MHKNLKRILAVILSLTAVATSMTVMNVSAALSKSELQSNINELEAKSKKLESEISGLQGQINAQEKLKSAIEQKIAVLQQQINLCNSEISKINSTIAANNAEIEKKNQEIEADKLSFKKRLRAIYMSDYDSNVKVLLGAENFSDFLQLSQLTASVSARDKLLIEQLVDAIKVLEKKQEENNKLLEEQVEIKKVIAEKQAELEKESNEIQSVINRIDADQSKLESDNAAIEKQIKDYQSALASQASAGNTSFVYDGGSFLWPVPSSQRITAGYQSNDSVHKGRHNGIDIGASNGAPIIAISDGVVVKSNNSCTHNYGKSGSCGCGGGYGNYVTINHGTKDGKTYVVTYGHMSSTAVSTGATIKKGQVIGYVGSTGWSTGFHLHFGMAVNGAWVNPMNYYRKVG